MFCATLLLASPLTCKTAHTPPQRRRAQLVPAFELSADFSVRNNQGWTSQRLHVEGLRRWYKTNDYCRVPATIRSASSAFSMKEVLPQVRRRFRSCSSLCRSGSLAEDRPLLERAALGRAERPAAQAAPGCRYLRDEGMEFISTGSDARVTTSVNAKTLDALAHGKLRVGQRPGPRNQLGRIKFVLPYLNVTRSGPLQLLNYIISRCNQS